MSWYFGDMDCVTDADIDAAFTEVVEADRLRQRFMEKTHDPMYRPLGCYKGVSDRQAMAHKAYEHFVSSKREPAPVRTWWKMVFK